MTGQEVLIEYAAVADLTGQMLAAAEAAVELTPTSRQAKIDCLRRILADDRKIRDLTMPWMAQLYALISNSGTQRRLANAYGSV